MSNCTIKSSLAILAIPILGIIMPNMSMININASNAIFSKAQQQVLGLLYGRADSDFYTNEIIRITNVGTGAVQRELAKLTQAGILTVKSIGNQKRYQANHQHPLFSELRSITLKTFGLADVLREAIMPLREKIDIAFIYGSIAKQTDHAQSDIDLMIISESLSYAEAFTLLEPTETQLGRKINPTFCTPTEWTRKKSANNNFITQLITQPKLFLIGTENELNAIR